MGCRASSNGVTLKFLDTKGQLDSSKPVIFGRFSKLYSAPRPANLLPNEQPGSSDWLTHVMVADSDLELKSMDVTDNTAALTSCSSNRVKVQFPVTDKEGTRSIQTMENQTTMAVGYLSPDQTHFIVEQVLAMPAETQLDKNHPLYLGWQFGAIQIDQQFEHLARNSPPGTVDKHATQTA